MSSLSRIVAMSVVWTSIVHAQSQPMIAGKVIDRSTHAVLARVTAELMATTGETVLDTAITANDGVFTLVAPRAGTYRVRFTASEAGTHVSDSLIVGDGEYLTREFAIDRSHREYGEGDVDKPVLPARGSAVPYYPDVMRTQGIMGCVLASFIVDTTGRADRGTIRILKYSDREFVRSIWDTMPRMRFVPAEFRGRKVPQHVVQEFNFSMPGYEPVKCTRPAKSNANPSPPQAP